MTDPQLFILLGLFFIVAMLYSSVGHAGASGYLAAMALVGVAAATMRPTALVLNIAVAALATWRFQRAGHVKVKRVAPFWLGSVPLAFIGGSIKLPGHLYQILVGAVLLCSAAYLAWRASTLTAAGAENEPQLPKQLPMLPCILIGAAIGFLSGLTGTGGGIFLSPLLLLMHWAGPKSTAGISAPFILLNSIAGLLGGLLQGGIALSAFSATIAPLALAALCGGAIGSWVGAYKLSNRWLNITLAVVMTVAAIKLLGLAWAA
jgi:uncharacterized protein